MFLVHKLALEPEPSWKFIWIGFLLINSDRGYHVLEISYVMFNNNNNNNNRHQSPEPNRQHHIITITHVSSFIS